MISRPTLERRAALLAQLRGFMSERGLLEVDTPVLYPATPAEPGLDTFPVGMPDGATWFLQPSPEFALKRLLALHPTGLYQLGHVFRRGENGRLHNSEFTMLEWYLPGRPLAALETDCIDLLQVCLGALPVQQASFYDLFAEHVGLDLDQASPQALQQAAVQILGAATAPDQSLDLLFEARIRPALTPEALTVIAGFPAAQSELSTVAPDDAGVPRAQRFEIFHQGMELVNAAVELRDGTVYRERVAANNALRSARGLPTVAPDEALAATLSDLPDCVGAALGVDRLLMCLLGAQSIAEVMPFTQPAL